jgi:hypothetical protein
MHRVCGASGFWSAGEGRCRTGLCAADEAPPDGCDFHSHADERSVEERTFSCQVEQAWLVRFATDLKQSDGTFGIATLWCRGGQGKALLVERAA